MRMRVNDVLSQQDWMGVAMFARHIMFMNSLKSHELRQLNFVLQPLHNFLSQISSVSARIEDDWEQLVSFIYIAV